MNPGDVVTCVNTDSPCGCPDAITDLPQPVIGRHYRVAEVGRGICRVCGTVVPCMDPTSPILPDGKCWPQSCFAIERPDATIPHLSEKVPEHA